MNSTRLFTFALRAAVLLVIGFGLFSLAYVPPGGTRTRTDPQTEEDISWAKFKRDIRKDRRFRGITVKHFRGVYWAEGALKTETDFNELVALAKECGIEDERLDGPYQDTISITVPGTNRAKTRH